MIDGGKLVEYGIRPMEAEDADIISRWAYEGEYALYNMENTGECIAELMNGKNYAALDSVGELIGYYCFHESAQVPAGRTTGAYADNSFLDIGLGMKPQLCGHGMGYGFLCRGIDFGKQQFLTASFRLTVAEFNQRAIKVYEKAGFVKSVSFIAIRDRKATRFWVMHLDLTPLPDPQPESHAFRNGQPDSAAGRLRTGIPPHG
jgi:[ribosomal protein S18]-alanine N-acetyltransferase